MKSKITDKFQITIPKEIRKRLHLAKNDIIEWDIKKGYIIIKPVQNPFLKYMSVFRTGSGDISDDIKNARKARSEKIVDKNK